MFREIGCIALRAEAFLLQRTLLRISDQIETKLREAAKARRCLHRSFQADFLRAVCGSNLCAEATN